MAARPPTGGVDDEPEIEEFGIVALDGAIEQWGLSFPLSADELASQYGDERVSVDPAGNEMRLGDALEQCPTETFESKQALLNALHPVFEAERERLSNTILGRLRSLVPF